MPLAAVDASRFGPIPPIGSHIGNSLNEWIFLWGITAVCVGCFVAAIIIARRTRSWIPIMCMLGGLLTIFTEPMIDQHLQVWWPAHHEPNIYSGYGRNIPLLVLPVLGYYFGGGVLVRWFFLRRYGRRFPIWTIFAIETAAAVVLEPPAIQLGIWHYYGYQGIRLWGYPLWWPIVGGTCGVVAGTMVYRLEPYLKSWRVLAVPIVIPMGVVATYWAVGWPMFNMLNHQAAHGLVIATTLVTTTQAVFVVWVCSIVTGHHAYRRELKEARAEPQPGLAPVSPERAGTAEPAGA